MSTTPEAPTLEERAAQLEITVELLAAELDYARTANEVLQTRYGTLADQYAALDARVGALEAP